MRWVCRLSSVACSLALGLSTSCGSGSFTCSDDEQCKNAGAQGTCELSGGCSFPDPACDSGRRYGEHAPGGLGGTCVPLDMSTTQTSDDSVGVTSLSSTSLDGGDSEGSTTMAASATNTTSTESDTGNTSVGTSGTDGATGSTGGDPASFFDPFDRPDAATIGNGWVEKTPGAFRLLDEQVELESTNGLDFRNNLFYRPLAESMLDVEASMVVNFVTDDPFGYPQMHLRVQAADIEVQDSLTSYAVFVDTGSNEPSLTVNRIAGPGFGPAVSEPIAPPPVDAETYRLRGRVTGTDPVVLEGFFEVWDGNTWQVRTEATLMDTQPSRITTPGTVGAGGHVELQYFVLDDFGYAELGG